MNSECLVDKIPLGPSLICMLARPTTFWDIGYLLYIIITIKQTIFLYKPDFEVTMIIKLDWSV